jgi:hypothetical protein
MAHEQPNKSLARSKEIKQSVAKKYVDEQLALLRRHGGLGKISKGTYDSIVSRVTRVTR